MQYYRNVNGIELIGNKNLAGEINLSKYPQLTSTVVIKQSPLVTSVNATGLDKINKLSLTEMDGLKKVTTGNNTQLVLFELHKNRVLEEVDASNMPSLKVISAYYSPKITTINTTNSPNLEEINAISTGSLISIIALEDKANMMALKASGSKIESYDFTNMPKIREINLASAAVKELKGLSAAGANLENLQLSNTKLTSLDVSNNPNLKWLDVYGVKGLTTLDLTNNLELLQIRTSFASNLRELKLGNHTKLTELKVAHCKLTELDIRKFQNLKTLYAGSQQPNGFLANIVVKMTAAQKTRLEAVKPFVESGNDARSTFEDTNSWVKVVVE